MKKYLYILLAASVTLGASAQGKVDIGSRARLRHQQAPVIVKYDAKGTPVAFTEVKRSRAEAADLQVRAFVTPVKGADTSALEALCYDFKPSRVNDLIMVTFPASALDEIEALECVAAVKIEQQIGQKMNLVRPLVGIDKIHAGEDLPQAYTGKGVLCGIVDGGFDPNHLNFLNADGTHRVKQFTYFAKSTDPNATKLIETRTYGNDIYKIDTENEESFHATHTAGIMAGGYRGKINAGVMTSAFAGEIQEIDNPYYGVATGADIIMASAYDGQLSDYYIAMGIESMLDYAYDAKQPLSVNLSLGSNVGPHDGTSPICQYLDAVCDYDDVNTIVSVSAGNEGDQPIVLKHTFESDGEMYGAGLNSVYNGQIQGYQNPRSGLVYIYSDSDQPFEVIGQVVNTGRTPSRLVCTFPLPESPEGGCIYWTSDASWIQDKDTDKVSTNFGRYFNGYIGIQAMVDESSGRYYAVIDFTSWDMVKTAAGTDGANKAGNYALGFVVKGHEGQRIDIYGDGGMCNFTTYGYADYHEGITDGTINDIATGHLPIIVGSYNVRSEWASMDGKVYGYGSTFPYGKMSVYTSYGNLLDGRVKPDICAPGTTVISSANGYYFQSYLDAGYLTETSLAKEIQGSYNDGKRDHHWYQCLGTSMAAPVVAGTMALWLEANPDLSTAEARKILEETAVKDDAVLNSGKHEQWGWGKLDAYAGLKKVIELKNAGVDNVLVDSDSHVTVRPLGGNCYEVLGGDCGSLSIEVYNMQGAAVKSLSSAGNEAIVDCSSLAPGVYVISVNNSFSQKISVNP